MEKVKKVLEFIKKSLLKRNVQIVLGVILLAIVCLVIYACCTKENHAKMNNLKIEYVGGPNFKVKNVKEGYTLTKKIKVENTSDDNVTYSFSFKDVKNTFKDQSKLTYTVKGTGDYAASLGKSQAPVVGFKVFQSVVVQAKKTQEYEITFTFSGDASKEKDSEFSGKLDIYSKEVDKKALEKEREEQEKKLKEELEKQTKETTTAKEVKELKKDKKA